MSAPALQLFPAPPPKAARPKRKGSRRNATKLIALAGRAKSPTPTKKIVIHVTEDVAGHSSPNKSSSDENIERSQSPSRPPPPPSAAAHPQSRTASPALTNHHRLDTPSGPAPSQSRAASPALTNNHSVLSGTVTLVRSNSEASNAAAPIRSIFPRYNPAIPLSQQNYRPTQLSPKHIAPAHISKEAYSPSLYSTAGSPSQASPGRVGCLSAPSAITSFPAGVLSNHRPQYSNPEELADLWEAANGQVTKETGKTFALRMSRSGFVSDIQTNLTTDLWRHREGPVHHESGATVPTIGESFTFGASKERPFYDFQTLRPNEFDPEFSECHIRRRDPRKGTIIPIMTFTFEPASRRDSPQDGLVTNFYPKIAAMMALDGARLQQQQQQQSQPGGPDPDGVMSTTTEERRDEEAVRRAEKKEGCKLFWDHDSRRYYLLHPGLSKNGEGERFVIVCDKGVGFNVAGARGTIRLIDPHSHETLVGLEFGTATLLVDTRATAKIPSFYMVDISISAVIAVALIEGRKIRSTMMRQHQGGTTTIIGQGLTSPTSMPLTIQDQQRTIALDEGGQELPKPTQGILSVLMFLFQSIVWLLSVLVGTIAAVVVGVTACFQAKSK